MLSNVIFAQRNLAVADYSPQAVLGRVAELWRYIERRLMRLLSLLVLSQMFFAFQTIPSRADETIRFQCSHHDPSNSKVYRIIQYLGSDQKFGASWGEEFRKGQYASCGFTDGRKFLLTDMNLFVDRSTVVDKSVVVYRGIGNHCSEGKLLIFNDRTKLVMILNVHDLTTEKYQCAIP